MTDKRRRALTFCLAACILILVLPLVAAAAPVTTEGSGSTAAAIQGQVDIFRGILGDPLNGNSPGPLSDGRQRSIGMVAAQQRQPQSVAHSPAFRTPAGRCSRLVAQVSCRLRLTPPNFLP